MNATITRETVTRNIGLLGRKGRYTVDVWIVSDERGPEYGIETRDHDRALAYAAALDAGDDATVERMLAEHL